MTSKATDPAPQESEPDAQELQSPACVMSFNASDSTGAGGVAADIATIAAMGGHALPVVTTIVMRDTAEVFDHHPIDDEVVVEQAR
ncbi:MAG: bifunctional hydroxymethylpyrimidine kinase/phosphomethylpyrimidine kinase, partial [Leptothrix sp. (in: Bacteria)]|nr:bifunctional hydroxymethylpyrimidine kinase/phosphomethylpyrimidine kinase [Leptothrix sp. (in: b-proteobacteria)]